MLTIFCKLSGPKGGEGVVRPECLGIAVTHNWRVVPGSPPWTDLGSDPGICREKPAINCWNYGMACLQHLMCQDCKICE